MILADAHVHIDLYPDRERVLNEAAMADVVPVIVSTRPSEYRNLQEKFADRAHRVRIALGIHPEAAGSVYEAYELAILEAAFGTTIWIGEIGLDAVIAESVGSFFGNEPTIDHQKRLFERVLSLGVQKKALSVHSRGAESLAVDMLQRAGARAVALHWYRGDRTTATRAIDLGFFLSVNIAMVGDAAGRQLLEWMPETAILFETDGPFTATGGRPSEPKDVHALAGELATLRQTDAESLSNQVSANFLRLEQLLTH